MPFGQLIIGPPASGKTAYCNGMQQFMGSIGRKVAIVNLDPANDYLPYDVAVDISELISVDKIMDEHELGPNGGLIYAMEYLEKNIEWLKSRLDHLKEFYVLFDCPGQIELYTHHNSIRNITEKLEKWGYRMTCIHLVDCIVCTDPSNYISALLLCLTTMLQLQLPHINVLSKIDLLSQYSPLDFHLEYYTNVLDLNYLLDLLSKNPFSMKFKKLNSALCELIDDFGLVSFQLLNIQEKESVYKLLQAIDKSNGYVYGACTIGNESIMLVAEQQPSSQPIDDLEEKYISLVGDITEH